MSYIYIYIYGAPSKARNANVVYTGCHRRKGPNFGRVFLRSNYTDNPKHLYPKFDGYGDIEHRKVRACLVSA